MNRNEIKERVRVPLAGIEINSTTIIKTMGIKGVAIVTLCRVTKFTHFVFSNTAKVTK